MKNPEELKRAKSAALRYLAYRNRSSHEVREHLSKKGFPPPIVENTVDYLKSLNYLNDKNFAQSWGRSRTQTKKIGKQRLRHELLTKGLESEIVKDALQSIYSEIDELQLARDCVQKKISGMKEMDINKKRRRMAQYLARKGFTAATVYAILGQLLPLKTDE